MLPSYLLKKIPKQRHIRKLRTILPPELHTVCEEAKCPNIGECFSQNTCTFMILGNICTRNCAFCGVSKGKPLPPDPEEPERIAKAVKKLGLKYVVVTSVTRDDLPDGGASQFAAVISKLQIANYKLQVEVLIPDFQGKEEPLKTALEARPYVLNHNLETVPRLYPKIRPQADYKRSLNILRQTKIFNPKIYTKSGFMVGLGESDEEIREVLYDLKEVDCNMVTIGQYLPPSKLHLQPEKFVTPEEFEEHKKFGEGLGLKVLAGPFVRSSFHARINICVIRKVSTSRCLH